MAQHLDSRIGCWRQIAAGTPSERRVFPYFVGTTAVTIGIGIGLTLFIEPGGYINADMIKHIMEGSPAAQVHVESNGTHLADQNASL